MMSRLGVVRRAHVSLGVLLLRSAEALVDRLGVDAERLLDVLAEVTLAMSVATLSVDDDAVDDDVACSFSSDSSFTMLYVTWL